LLRVHDLPAVQATRRKRTYPRTLRLGVSCQNSQCTRPMPSDRGYQPAPVFGCNWPDG
jgi:hypothetical protein